MADVSHIVNWGADPSDHLEHIEKKVVLSPSVETDIKFFRRVATMHPDEVVFVRVIWLLCELRQIDWKKYNECAKVVCISSDAEITSVGEVSVYGPALNEAAFKLIRGITSYDRGAIYAGYKEAVIAMSKQCEAGSIRNFLLEQSEILNA